MAQDQNAYKLTGAAVAKLAKLVRDSERHSRNYHPPRYRRPTLRSSSSSANGWITFTTAAALLATDASQASCPVVLVWEGPDPGSTVTVYNELGFEADAGVDGYAKKCAADGKWKIVIIPCPAGSS